MTEANETSDPSTEDALRNIASDAVLVLGTVPSVLIERVSALYTEVVVMTGERYRHIVERHPELRGRELLILEALRDPDAIHRNERDPDILILYRASSLGGTLRLALWISEEDGRSNSIHSARFAHAQEEERGTRRGKVIWRRS